MHILYLENKHFPALKELLTIYDGVHKNGSQITLLKSHGINVPLSVNFLYTWKNCLDENMPEIIIKLTFVAYFV
jgi:hypothetical protein